MKRILIVDDDLNFRRVLKHQLREMGFDVDEAADGRAALECTSKTDYALLLVDINMPVMDGLNFIRIAKIRKPEIHVVVLSAFSSMKNVASALRYGAEEFLEKPYETTLLQEKVLRVLA